MVSHGADAMVRELERTEISEIADLAQLVDEVRASGRPRALTRNGEAIAEIRPLAPNAPRRGQAGHRRSEAEVAALTTAFRENRVASAQPDQRRGVRIPTEAELATSHSAAGGWRDVDVDRLIADIYADRDQADRPPIAL